MLIAHELERRILVPLFDRQEEAPERCCLITTAASRQRPELRAFRAWILREAARPPPAATGFPTPDPAATTRLRGRCHASPAGMHPAGRAGAVRAGRWPPARARLAYMNYI